MNKIIRKAYFDFEKEEKWLNEMAHKGLALKKYTWCKYEFEDVTDTNYIYRLELLDNLASHPDSLEYIRFLEENNIEHISSYLRWIYLRKDAKDGPFDLFTDKESKIKHYKRVFTFFITFMFLELFIGIINISIGLGNSVANSDTQVLISTNLILGTLCVFAGLLFFKFAYPLKGKINRLREERLINE